MNEVPEGDRKIVLRLLFLKGVGNREIEEEEMEELDVPKIMKRLELGESVFITSKLKHYFKRELIIDKAQRAVSKKDSRQSLYVVHV